MGAVGLVGRRDDHPRPRPVLADRLEQHVRPANVGLPGRERRPVGCPHLCLSREVKDRARVVLGKYWAKGVELSREKRAAIAEALAVEARTHEVRPTQHQDVLAAVEQLLHERAADQALRPGY